MQNPIDHAEAASIPTESSVVSEQAGPNLGNQHRHRHQHQYPYRTFTVRRKAAKRSESWYQPFFTPARKKIRLLEEPPLPTTTDEADRETVTVTAAPDVSAGLSPPPAAAIDNDANNADFASDTQPKTGASNEATGSWTAEEDAELTTAVAKTKKKLWGKEYKINWPAISPLVAGRTKYQCHRRWRDVLDPSIALAAGRKGRWTVDEDLKLKAAAQMHDGKDWGLIVAFVPGRTREQCRKRWKAALEPSIALTAGHTGLWAEDEDLKLQHSVQMHGGKDWAAIAVLVPGRTTTQCWNRWQHFLNPSIALSHGRTTGVWGELDDINLENAVHAHNGKNWFNIATLVPGRTKRQCYIRWEKRKAQSMT
jgi:hypothetical protein